MNTEKKNEKRITGDEILTEVEIASASPRNDTAETARNDTGGRDYTRRQYQNFMAIHKILEANAPLPVTQKQIMEGTGISKNVVFEVCWNMAAGGWAEDTGNGGIRLKQAASDKEAYLGRMVLRMVRDAEFKKE